MTEWRLGEASSITYVGDNTWVDTFPDGTQRKVRWDEIDTFDKYAAIRIVATLETGTTDDRER